MNTLNTLLNWPRFRHAAIHAIKTEHYADLELSIPIDSTLKAPLCFPDAGPSFNEIFIQEAYAPLKSLMPWPRHWLDIGCHYGFFSLWLYMNHARNATLDQCSATLVDADARSTPAIAALRKLNALPESQCRFLHGAIAAVDSPLFKQRRGMGSTLASFSDARYQNIYAVPRITEQELQKAAPLPLDLLKLDVEGAELIFLKHYARVARQARYLLIEWHSWAPEWAGTEALDTICHSLDFRRITSLGEDTRHVVNNTSATCGTVLYKSLHP